MCGEDHPERYFRQLAARCHLEKAAGDEHDRDDAHCLLSVIAAVSERVCRRRKKLANAKSAVDLVQGKAVKINVTDGKVKVDAANVTKTDIATSNGVIHVIDAVILPPAK